MSNTVDTPQAEPPKQRLNSHGIGASEIAAIAGLSPYASPWNVWLRKTGQAEDETNAKMEWGHRLEPAIRQAYVDQTKAVVHVPSTSLFHRETQWARATPDGIVLKDGNPIDWAALVQCKNVGYWVEKSWSAAPPQYVQLQEQWELYVTETERADIAVLIGGNDFRIYTVHRDDGIITDLVEIAAKFWDRVQTRTPPPVDASEACRDHFTKKLVKADAVELVADAELEPLMYEWRDLHVKTRAFEKRIDEIRNSVLCALADVGTDRIKSEVGTAKLQRRGGKSKPSTDWKLVAELLGSTKCTQTEWISLVEQHTTSATTPLSVSLYPPREWQKE